MCGIVGYVGDKQALPVVIEGLKKLEYRGYDSSGVALVQNGKIGVTKEVGKIVRLQKKLQGQNNSSGLGIGHTRWATHGEPTVENAHPHCSMDGKICLVHNGIVENYKFLRTELQEKGYLFNSQTDTEVLVNLISYFKSKENDTKKAIQLALKKVEGTYGIAVIDEDEPDRFYAARCGSPLIIGVGGNENYVASDASAIMIHTSNVIYLDDFQMACVTKDDFEITTLDDEPIEKKIDKVDWDISAITKNGYEHFMLKEICEQAETVQNAYRGRVSKANCSVRLGGFNFSARDVRNLENVQFVACGTSWHAAQVGKYLLEKIARIPVSVEYASEYRYRNPIIPQNTIVVAISQSGATADTLAAMREAKNRGAMVYGITNVVGSEIARESDGGTYLHAGPEIGVASTKAFTSQVTALALLAYHFGQVRGSVDNQQVLEFIEELEALPAKIDQVLEYKQQLKEVANLIKDSKNALFLGRDINFPSALEGALKLKEISYIHAEGYPAAEMKHGPIALIDENMPIVSIAPYDAIYNKIISNLEEVKSRKGKIYAVASQKDENLEAICQKVFYVPQTLWALMPILVSIPLQLLAYYVAYEKGLNIDQPRNLAKSVTVE